MDMNYKIITNINKKSPTFLLDFCSPIGLEPIPIAIRPDNYRDD
jgi:hypothetical protein